MRKAKENFINQFKENKIDESIIDSISEANRVNFFDPAFKSRIYQFDKLPIGHGQRSDNPLVLAKMLNILELKESWRVLEVGTGSGYSTALLSTLAEEVITIDYFEDLARQAKTRLLNCGYENIRFFAGDASALKQNLGYFDAVIILSACNLSPYSILNMLKPTGHAVFPMGPAHQQQIVSFVNSSAVDISVKNFKFHDLCVFDSIRGKYGWVDQNDSYIVDEAVV